MRRRLPVVALALALALARSAPAEAASRPLRPRRPRRAGRARPGAPAATADLRKGLVLALAQFVERDGKPVPGPARLEFLAYRGGKWQMSALEDPGEQRLPQGDRLRRRRGTAAAHASGGSAAIVKLWEKTPQGLVAQTALAARTSAGSSAACATPRWRTSTATAAPRSPSRPTIRAWWRCCARSPDGSFEAVELDHEPDTFVHEIEIGDLDGDGVLEVYATPSEPNRLDDRPQAGKVVRYVPKKGEGRTRGGRSRQAPREGDPGRRRRWGRPRRALRLDRGRGGRRGRQGARLPGRDPPLRRRHARPTRAP